MDAVSDYYYPGLGANQRIQTKVSCAASDNQPYIAINDIVVLLIIGITTIVFLSYAKEEFVLDLTNTGHVMSDNLAYNRSWKRRLPLIKRFALY